MAEKDFFKIHHFAVSEDKKLIYLFCLRGEEKIVLPMDAAILLKALPTLEYIGKEIVPPAEIKVNSVNNGQPLEIESISPSSNGAFSFTGKNSIDERFNISFKTEDSLKMISGLQKIINKAHDGSNHLEIRSYIPVAKYQILLDETGSTGIIITDDDGIEYSFIFPQNLALQFCKQISELVAKEENRKCQ